ncbi:MAG: hypothetical protein LBI78_04565 [Campylobacteraceae bacterium]|nr:hypothetical protein [Campylobacteraceae bacterium]
MKHFYGDGACINNLKVNKSWVLRSCYIFMRIAPNFFMLNGSGEFLDDTEWKSIKDEDVFKAS